MFLHVSVQPNHHQGAYSLCFAKVTILVSLKILRYRTVRLCGRTLIQSCWCVYRAHCSSALCTIHTPTRLD